MINKAKFRLKKDGTCRKLSFCTHPELIENYDLAIKDKERTWHCHHKKEEFYTSQELIDLGMYYNVPPEDLVFVRDNKEHKSWPHKGTEKTAEAHKGKPHSEETKRKISENHKGGKAKITVQIVETGQIFESIKAAREFVGLKGNISILIALKNPNRTAGGYHWRRS